MLWGLTLLFFNQAFIQHFSNRLLSTSLMRKQSVHLNRVNGCTHDAQRWTEEVATVYQSYTPQPGEGGPPVLQGHAHVALGSRVNQQRLCEAGFVAARG